ncbi:hypothetical protein M5689_002447 [Euphorbia peplus]|nr:hypothetical protein M5689_002447 [Euphorbia peplus]
MSSLQTSSLLFPCSSTSSTRVKSAISLPKRPSIHLPKQQSKPSNFVLEELTFGRTLTQTQQKKSFQPLTNPTSDNSNSTLKLYTIVEAVADRIEMHQNVAVQRDNWNKLLLNSTNMMILTATSMAGVASTSGAGDSSFFALNVFSTLLFGALTGMLLIINKIQPSQLAEEQRNATRLFKQLYNRIKTTLDLDRQNLTEVDVNDAMEKVFALDRAFPLPLLGGKMINKFPSTFEPPIWWTKSEKNSRKRLGGENNGWNQELETEMREIARVVEGKDSEDYMRLGNIALKVNKVLAVSGPLLTGIATAGSLFGGNLGGVVAATAGALACTVNTLEHGGQVGMVVEMYRNCAAGFKRMEETIETTLEESDAGKRENGEVFEMNLGLKLGRSPSEMRHLGRKASCCRRNGSDIDEFASKLF